MKYFGPAIFLAMLATNADAKTAMTNLPSGVAAYSVIPAESANANVAVGNYLIGPLDTVDVTVFQEPDLSAKALQVDAAGQIALPLVGTVQATGKTPAELSRELEKMLGAKYL